MRVLEWQRLELVCRGVVIVTAHVRGGGEHGRAWHMAATEHKKWAALYDFASALNYLVDAGITEPGRIACDSFSAGALLTDGILNQTPPESWDSEGHNNYVMGYQMTHHAYELQRGTRDTPNSIGAERRRAEANDPPHLCTQEKQQRNNFCGCCVMMWSCSAQSG
jgi:hypothetical protein